jgi:hypothetical protein
LQTFARRLRDDFDSRFQNVFGFEQSHLAAPAAEKLLEKFDKITVYRVKRLFEFLARTLFYFFQSRFRAVMPSIMSCRCAVKNVKRSSVSLNSSSASILIAPKFSIFRANLQPPPRRFQIEIAFDRFIFDQFD